MGIGMDESLLERYNYDGLVPEKFTPWMRFAESPGIEGSAPNFPAGTCKAAKPLFKGS
jgi:hypothetical protein